MSDTPNAAEQAFAALRAEIAALRHAVEAARDGGAAPPDYGPTLGAIVREIRAIDARVAASERVLREGLASMPRPIDPVRLPDEMTPGEHRLHHIADRLDALIGLPAEARTRRRHRLVASAVGAGVGVLGVWLLAATLPFGAGDWIAAIPLGGRRWQAGQALMQRDDPAGFERLARLAKACPPDIAVELCETELALAAAGARNGEGRPPPAADPNGGPSHRAEPAGTKARPPR